MKSFSIHSKYLSVALKPIQILILLHNNLDSLKLPCNIHHPSSRCFKTAKGRSLSSEKIGVVHLWHVKYFVMKSSCILLNFFCVKVPLFHSNYFIGAECYSLFETFLFKSTKQKISLGSYVCQKFYVYIRLYSKSGKILIPWWESLQYVCQSVWDANWAGNWHSVVVSLPLILKKPSNFSTCTEAKVEGSVIVWKMGSFYIN